MSPSRSATATRPPSHVKKKVKTERSARRRRTKADASSTRRRRSSKGSTTRRSAPPKAVAPARENRVDPRLTARRSAVSRTIARRRLILPAVLGGLTLAVLGGWFLVHSSVLSARVLHVSGSVHTPASEVLAASGLGDHPPMIDVDSASVAARIERLPWVKTATVARQWPDGVRITVSERRPVGAVALETAPSAANGSSAAGSSPGQAEGSSTPSAGTVPSSAPTSWAEVDATGRVLATVPAPPTGLVRLVVPVTPGVPGSALGSEAEPALVVAASLPPAYGAQVSAVQVSASGQVTLTLTSPVTVLFGSTAQLAQKEEDVAAVLAHASLSAGDVIDVAVPDSPTVTAAS
jgi:cell division protein FtsQ